MYVCYSFQEFYQHFEAGKIDLKRFKKLTFKGEP